MTAKPSDAPWTVTDRRDCLHTGGALFTAESFHFAVGNDEFTVAAIFGDGSQNRGMAEANARLVSAAPEMLEFVKLALAYALDTKERFLDHWDGEDELSYENLCDDADAILLKVSPPRELRQQVYTVTVSGREREDGEKPYDYVVEAKCLEDAVRQAVAAHMEEREDTNEQAEDLQVRCRRGLHEHGYYNDLRMPKRTRNHV